MLQVIAVAANEVLGGGVLTGRGGLGAGLSAVREKRAAGGKGCGFSRGLSLRGGVRFAGFAEFAGRTATFGTVFTTRAIFTTRAVAFGAGTVFTLGTIFTTRAIPFGALRAWTTVAFGTATFWTRATAFAARTTVVTTGTIPFGAFRARATVTFGTATFWTRATAFAARTTVITTAFATGTTITVTAFRTATLRASTFTATTVQNFVEFNGLQAKLRGHFLDNRLFKQVVNGFEADDDDDAHEQRSCGEYQSEKGENHEECFLVRCIPAGATQRWPGFAGLTRPDWIASLPVDAEKFRVRGEYSMFWMRGSRIGSLGSRKRLIP